MAVSHTVNLAAVGMKSAQCPVSFVEEISHEMSSMQKRKKLKKWTCENASERTMWVASVDATHTRVESAEVKGETMVGAKKIAT
jgi:hypothetical protein